MSEAKCPQCGSFLTYEPGTTNLRCPFCSAEVPIEQPDVAAEERDFLQLLHTLEIDSELEEVLHHRCSGCGAEIVFPPNVTAARCPYCTNPIVTEQRQSKKAIKPRYLLPFSAVAKEINDLFKGWIESLWLAPNDLKRLAETDKGVTGIYVPYWTFDADTTTAYSGLRGEIYMEPENYVVVRDGKEFVETRMVPRTRWTPAQGVVSLAFDDLLVMASTSLSPEYAQLLEPWDLENLSAYDSRYLSGFLAESYQVGLREGFDLARARMETGIRSAVAAQIGGDAQQVHSMRTAYDNITCKHILLPVWISAYRYRGKLYQFLVNARTREIQGERPWSTIKIVLTVLAGTLVAFGLAYFLGEFP